MRIFALLLLLATLPVTVFASVSQIDESEYAPYEGRLIEAIALTGNSITKPHVIYREIILEVDSTFNMVDFREGLVRLENLSIFSSVRVEVTEGTNGIILDYQVKEMPWIIPYIKLRFTEQDGWSLGPSVTSLNLGGRAVYLSGYAIFGGVTEYSVRLYSPWTFGKRISVDLIAADLSRTDNLNEFDEDSVEFTPWVGAYLRKHDRIEGTVSYFRMKADRDDITLGDNHTDNFLRVGARYMFDSRDTWRNPTVGWLNELQVVHSGGRIFDSPGRWWSVDLDIRRYEPLVPRHNLNMGVLLSLQTGVVGEDLPGYFQYRMGGANSIRGYDVEVTGKELFGKNQMIFTTEYEYLVMPIRELSFRKWAVSAGIEAAAFFDWGSAWSESDGFDAENNRVGFGLGLRWLVPGINVIRTDVAIGRDGKIFFHLGMGEKFEAQRQRIR